MNFFTVLLATYITTDFSLNLAFLVRYLRKITQYN